MAKERERDSKGSKATKCSASSKKSETASSKKSETLTALLKAQASFKLPNIESKIFSGEDVVEYNTFKLLFQRLIEDKCLLNEDWNYYLLHYTSGEAQAGQQLFSIQKSSGQPVWQRTHYSSAVS